MKRFLFLVSMVMAWSAFGQAPLLRTTTTTNQTSTNLFWDATNLRLGIRRGDPTHTLTIGSGGNGVALYDTADQTVNYRRLFLGGLGSLFAVNLNTAGSVGDGILRVGNLNSALLTTAVNIGQTNIGVMIQDNTMATFDGTALRAAGGVFTNSFQLISGASAGLVLTANAVGVGTWAGGSSSPVTNFYSISNHFTVSKGGHLVISNSFTILTNGVATLSNLPSPSVLVLNTDQAITNAILSGLTLVGNTLTASGGGGASVWQPNTALTYSGSTNLTIDGSGNTNFYVVLTNTAFFTTPNNVPASASSNTTFTVYFQQDATGGRLVTWTNGSFVFPGNVPFLPSTNASSISYVTFSMSPFSAGKFIGDYGVIGVP